MVRLGLVVLVVAAACSACGSKSSADVYSTSAVRKAFAAQGEALMAWPGSEAIKTHHVRGVFAAADPSESTPLRVMVYDRVYPMPAKSALCGAGIVDAITGKSVAGPCEVVLRARNVQVFYTPTGHASEVRRIRSAVAALRRG